MMKKDVKFISALLQEEQSLIFNDFQVKNAHTIGLNLVNQAQVNELSITIDIQLGKHQVFHYACEGTNEENDDWVNRKNNVTVHFGHSSYYMSQLLLSNGETLLSAYGLDEVTYAAFGGSFPIKVRDRGVIGTITVSGLLDHLDHKLVVDAIKWYLKQ